MNERYSIEIVARGEGLVYREGVRTLNFSLHRHPRTGHLVFHPYASFDARFRLVRLSPEDHEQVVTRIVRHLESKGETVQAIGRRPSEPPRDHAKEMEENLIATIMKGRSLSESEAREWAASYQRRYLAKRKKIYSFLKAHNPKVAELEESGVFAKKIWQVSASMRISEATATALVISSEVMAPGQLALMRKHRRLRRKKSTHEDIQEMLGVTVPIPRDIWDALGLDAPDESPKPRRS